jgi:hypothetical protein
MLKPVFFKSFIFIGIVGSLFLIQSCGSDEEDPVTDEITVDDDYYEFQDFSLKDYGLDAYIKLPDETANIGASTKPDVTHAEDHQWSISIGRNFQLLIEDYGDIKNLVEDEKKRLADLEFFKVKYIVDEKDLDGKKKASPTVGVEHRTYHVYGHKEINGVNYELKSREEGYEKNIIELVGKSIKSLRPIEE